MNMKKEIIKIPIPIPNEPWYEAGKSYKIVGEVYTYEELRAFSIMAEEGIGDTITEWYDAGHPPTLKKYIEEKYPPVKVFKINIRSTPSRAKLYIDGTDTQHLTPSDENELRDVMHLLTPGLHTIKATKAGKTAEKRVGIFAGDNGEILLSLRAVGL